MNFDDETILSAFLDGQLEPDQVQMFESALVSNPRLGEQLRALTDVRDLIGGLSRDRTVDVSSTVLERIRARRRWRPQLVAISVWPAGRDRIIRSAGVIGVAAAILVMIVSVASLRTSLWKYQPAQPGSTKPITITHRHPAKLRPEIGVTSSAAPKSTASIEPSPSEANGMEPHPTVGGEQIAANDETNGLEQPGELEHVRQLLDNPQLKRILWVRDGKDGSGSQQVGSVVEQTTRFDFYKITISHGIVIDPHHPDEATVFALLVSPKELDTLREKLRIAMPERCEETQVDPSIVTQLAEIKQVQAYTVTPRVTIARESFAMRHGGSDVHEESPADISPAGKRPIIVKESIAPVPTSVASGALPDGETADMPGAGGVSKHAKNRVAISAAPAPSRNFGSIESGARSALRVGDRAYPGDNSEETIVVLVWVTRSRPG